MKIIEKLMNEHQLILQMLDNIDAQLQTDADIDSETATQYVDFITQYADEYHHSKEEDILFVALRSPDVDMHCDPMTQMLHEHDIGRQCVARVKEGLANGDQYAIKEGLGQYTSLLRQHIYKEDNILYPMALQALNADSKEAVDNDFHAKEEALQGNDIQAKYEALAGNLAPANR